ncbi:MAG: phasin family protein [Pseudomonadota bacterium]
MAKKKKKEKAPGGSDMARKIWLAGVGAYGRAFSEAQESIAKVSDETTRLFDDLVERGEEIEDAVESRGREIAKTVRKPSFSIEDRIREMRERLNRVGADADRLSAVETRLDAIEAKLDQLLAAPATTRKAPAKRKTTRKTTKKTTKKATR